MTLEESIEEVEKGIQAFISDLPSLELYSPISYLLGIGGKRLRPALAILSNNYFGGEISDIIHPALAIEVFHNFSLMHDDIMDNAPLRRGKQTVHEKWNENAAILSGDAMLVQAYQMVLKSNSDFVIPINELFSKTALEVCEGQQLDMDFENRDDVTIDEYLKMITLKTSVLLACSLKMGAITARASEEDGNLMYEFGLNMGIAFQLRDDYLDGFGEMEKVGKQKGGDILSNKKTYLALKAWEKSSPAQRDILKELSAEKQSDVKVRETLQLFKKLEVDKDIEALSIQYFERAMHALNSTSGNPVVKEELLKFSEALMVREY